MTGRASPPSVAYLRSKLRRGRERERGVRREWKEWKRMDKEKSVRARGRSRAQPAGWVLAQQGPPRTHNPAPPPPRPGLLWQGCWSSWACWAQARTGARPSPRRPMRSGGSHPSTTSPGPLLSPFLFLHFPPFLLPNRQLEVELDRRALELAAQGVEDGDVDFGPVEGAVPFVDSPGPARRIQRGPQRVLGVVPHGGLA